MDKNEVLEGHRIIHHSRRSWGEGTIVEEDDKYIKVVFDNDEEAMNLSKFNRAYVLSSKMLQTFTEIYDRLILQTGV